MKSIGSTVVFRLHLLKLSNIFWNPVVTAFIQLLNYHWFSIIFIISSFKNIWIECKDCYVSKYNVSKSFSPISSDICECVTFAIFLWLHLTYIHTCLPGNVTFYKVNLNFWIPPTGGRIYIYLQVPRPSPLVISDFKSSILLMIFFLCCVYFPSLFLKLQLVKSCNFPLGVFTCIFHVFS